MSLVLSGLSKRYRDGTWAVRNLDLTIGQGEFFAILGPSGSGKTTTLRMIAGLEEITEGEILLNGRRLTHVPPQRRDVAMVFQDYALYPNYTVERNLAFPLKMKGLQQNEVSRRVQSVAKQLNLEYLMGRRPRELSGGERQRVALGRALVREPTLFLLDEPFGSLDLTLRQRMRIDLRHLQSRLKVTTVLVTHDQGEALSLADRLAIFDRGRMLQVATPREVYDEPADLAVARFVGSPSMTLFRAEMGTDGAIRLGVGDPCLPQVPADRAEPVLGRIPRRIVVGLRPEHFRLRATRCPRSFPASVAFVEEGGAQRCLVAQVDAPNSVLDDSGAVLTLIGRDEAFVIGQPVWLEPDMRKAVIFDGDSGTNLLRPR